MRAKANSYELTPEGIRVFKLNFEDSDTREVGPLSEQEEGGSRNIKKIVIGVAALIALIVAVGYSNVDDSKEGIDPASTKARVDEVLEPKEGTNQVIENKNVEDDGSSKHFFWKDELHPHPRGGDILAK